MEREEVPYRRQEQAGGCCYQAEEEDKDDRMLLVHEIMTQTGTSICDAAIAELEVEVPEEGGNMEDEEAVAEAYGRVSVEVSDETERLGRLALPEGRETSKEGDESNHRDCNGEYRDSLCEGHGGSWFSAGAWRETKGGPGPNLRRHCDRMCNPSDTQGSTILVLCLLLSFRSVNDRRW